MKFAQKLFLIFLGGFWLYFLFLKIIESHNFNKYTVVVSYVKVALIFLSSLNAFTVKHNFTNTYKGLYCFKIC